MLKTPFAFKRLSLSLFFFLLSFSLFSQNTSYTPLFTSSTFTKTIDVSKPVGVVDGAAGTTLTGGSAYSIPIYAPPGTNGLRPDFLLTTTPK
jgi:hypothetical protein